MAATQRSVLFFVSAGLLFGVALCQDYDYDYELSPPLSEEELGVYLHKDRGEVGPCLGLPYHDRFKANPIIRLSYCDWLGCSLNNELVKILLEEVMGFPAFSMPNNYYTVNYPALRQGDYHLELELWTSETFDSYSEYVINNKWIDSLGPLGLLGRNGWYIEDKFVDEQPLLAGWRALKDPAVTEWLGGKFYRVREDWGPDDQVIKNLGLDLVSVDLNDEDPLLAKVLEFHEQGKPALFYMWTPHWIQKVLKLSRLSLPAYSESCYAKFDDGGVDCDYPTDVIQKLAFVGLKDMAPAVHSFISRFGMSNGLQEVIMGYAVENGTAPEQRDPFGAACRWIKENEETWRNWIPADSSCQPGQYRNDQACLPCSPGFISLITEAPTCDPCPAGTYQSELGQTTCIPCAEGHFADTEGSPLCAPCPYGTFVTVEGSVMCNECPPRQYQDERGTTYCNDCQPGFFNNKHGQRICDRCSPGQFSSDNASISCETCPRDSSNFFSALLCRDCSLQDTINVFSPVSEADCRCIQGYYGVPRQGAAAVLSDDEEGCRVCPLGGVCCSCLDDAPNEQVLGNLSDIGRPCQECVHGVVVPIPKPGYYLSHPANEHGAGREETTGIVAKDYIICPCQVSKACMGGPESTCAPGYRGKRCAECEGGYYKLGIECYQCRDWMWVLVVLTFLLVPALVYMSVWMTVHHMRMSSVIIMINLFQMMALLPLYRLNWPEPVLFVMNLCSLLNFNVELLALECYFGSPAYEYRIILWLLMPVFFAIIFAALWPLFALIERTFREPDSPEDLSLPPSVEFSPTSPASPELASPTSPGSDEPARELRRLTAMKFTRVGGVEVPKYDGLRRIIFDAEPRGDIILGSYILFLMTAYVALVLKTMEAMICQRGPDGLSFVVAAPHVDCYTSKWSDFLALSLIGFIVYGLGLPALGLYFLYRYKSLLDTPKWRRRLGHIIESYEKKTIWWDVFDMARTTFIVIGPAIFTQSPSIAGFWGLMVVLTYLLFEVKWEPFKFNMINKIDILTDLATMITLMAGQIWYAHIASPAPTEKDVLTYIQLIYFLGVSTFLLYVLVKEARLMWTEHKVKRGLHIPSWDFVQLPKSVLKNAREMSFRTLTQVPEIKKQLDGISAVFSPRGSQKTPWSETELSDLSPVEQTSPRDVQLSAVDSVRQNTDPTHKPPMTLDECQAALDALLQSIVALESDAGETKSEVIC